MTYWSVLNHHLCCILKLYHSVPIFAGVLTAFTFLVVRHIYHKSILVYTILCAVTSFYLIT